MTLPETLASCQTAARVEALRFYGLPHSTYAPGDSMPARTPRRPSQTLTIRCGGCTTTWSGTARAHCSVCHRTFNTVGPFEQHRVGGACANPIDLEMINRDGIWGGQAITERWWETS